MVEKAPLSPSLNEQSTISSYSPQPQLAQTPNTTENPAIDPLSAPTKTEDQSFSASNKKRAPAGGGTTDHITDVVNSVISELNSKLQKKKTEKQSISIKKKKRRRRQTESDSEEEEGEVIGDGEDDVEEEESNESNMESEDENRELLELSRQIDEKLNEKAKRHNLTTFNVKSILHYVMKQPNMVNVILGLQTDTDVNLRLTRSKVKQLSKQLQRSADGKSPTKKAAPSLFDVEFEENEEDVDYDPENSDNEESDGEDGQSISLPPTPANERHLEDTPQMSPMQSYSAQSAMQPPSQTSRHRLFSQSISQCSQQSTSDQDLIALHTRSKQSFAAIPIHQLETNLQDPDMDRLFDQSGTSTPVNTHDVDNQNWTEFLRSLAGTANDCDTTENTCARTSGYTKASTSHSDAVLDHKPTVHQLDMTLTPEKGAHNTNTGAGQQTGTTVDDADEDLEDPDYLFDDTGEQMEDKAADEYILNRKTAIPRHEVQGLVNDLIVDIRHRDGDQFLDNLLAAARPETAPLYAPELLDLDDSLDQSHSNTHASTSAPANQHSQLTTPVPAHRTATMMVDDDDEEDCTIISKPTNKHTNKGSTYTRPRVKRRRQDCGEVNKQTNGKKPVLSVDNGEEQMKEERVTYSIVCNERVTEPDSTVGESFSVAEGDQPVNHQQLVMVSMDIPSCSLIQPEPCVPYVKEEEALMLYHQMRQHIQLVTQLHLLALDKKQADLYQGLVEETHQLLTELHDWPVDMKDEHLWNLAASASAIAHYHTVTEDELTALPKLIQNEKSIVKNKRNRRKDSAKLPLPSLRIRLVLARSQFMIDPDLVPIVAAGDLEYLEIVLGTSEMDENEEWLFAIGLSQFSLPRKNRPKQITCDWRALKVLLLPNYTEESLRGRYQNAVRRQHLNKVTMEWRRTGQVPAVPPPANIFCPTQQFQTKAFDWPENRQPKWLLHVSRHLKQQALYDKHLKHRRRPHKAKVWWRYVRNLQRRGISMEPPKLVDRGCSPIRFPDEPSAALFPVQGVGVMQRLVQPSVMKTVKLEHA